MPSPRRKRRIWPLPRAGKDLAEANSKGNTIRTDTSWIRVSRLRNPMLPPFGAGYAPVAVGMPHCYAPTIAKLRNPSDDLLKTWRLRSPLGRVFAVVLRACYDLSVVGLCDAFLWSARTSSVSSCLWVRIRASAGLKYTCIMIGEV